MNNKGLVLACLLLVSAVSCKKEPDPQPTQNLPHHNALKFLFQKQSADGAWRSETYNALSEGHALTPMVLLALSHVPEEDRKPYASQIQKAMDFLLKHNTTADSLREYPTYSLSLTVLALADYKPPGWQEMASRLARTLRSWQAAESSGWNRNDTEYGGWDIGGRAPTKINIIQINISNTVFALEALHAADALVDARMIEKAEIFLKRCQNPDGGFCYTPTARESFQNKAGLDGERYRSYGSATADGIRALLATGADAKDPRLTSAVSWIHHRFSPVTPGFPENETGKSWRQGLLFYYLYGLGRASEKIPMEHVRMEDIRNTLSRSQRPDGAWINPIGLMKEDDPLIATSLALTAWGIATKSLDRANKPQ